MVEMGEIEMKIVWGCRPIVGSSPFFVFQQKLENTLIIGLIFIFFILLLAFLLPTDLTLTLPAPNSQQCM